MIDKAYVKLVRFVVIPGVVIGGAVALALKEPWRGYVIGITIAAVTLALLSHIIVLSLIRKLKLVRAAWKAAARDRAAPLSEIARLKLAAFGRAAVSEIARLMEPQKDRAWRRELGGWPLIWKRRDTGEYIIKVRYIDADVAYNRLVLKLTGGTGVAWFLLLMLGGNGTEGARFGGGIFIGLVFAALSFPVWWGYFQVRLTFTLHEGRISWTVWGTEWGKDKGGYFPDGAKLEVPQGQN